ncbi:hypothetical protein EU524_00810 [Candidatus Thorarchaeota archaeon]|nr:MAG: hypothetical protein EU524_00810 [Candidatus Thorarchaeota archaeon]
MMQNESGPNVTDSGSSWGKIGDSLNSSSSLPFMQIRYKSLGKAMDEIRHKRMRLEDAKRRGHINDSDYASSLLKIIVETKSLTEEREEIAERLKAMKN